MKRLPLLVFSFYLLVSCGSADKTVFDQTVDIPNATWMRFEPTTFSVDVPNADDCYELSVALDIDTARYRETALPLIVKIESEAEKSTGTPGETRTLFATVMLRPETQDGTLFRQRIREYFYFNRAGTYNVTVGQRTSHYELPGIRKVGFTIRKAQLELPK